jgi:hypothetical protein
LGRGTRALTLKDAAYVLQQLFFPLADLDGMDFVLGSDFIGSQYVFDSFESNFSLNSGE